MKRYLFIIFISLNTVSCSQKTVPIGLRKTINDLERNLNDTIKYDFKISTENVAGTKHHFGLGLALRNGKGLWRGSMLKSYFKINGIKHPDDMSGIILTTLHRKLNNKPIEFKEQKRYYKEYWKVAKIGRDTLARYWEKQYKLINHDSIDNVYYSYFTNGRLVLGSVGAWTPLIDGHASGTDVKMIGRIIERNDKVLKVKINYLGNYDHKFELIDKVGDTILTNLYDVFLIPSTGN